MMRMMIKDQRELGLMHVAGTVASHPHPHLFGHFYQFEHLRHVCVVCVCMCVLCVSICTLYVVFVSVCGVCSGE